MTLAVGMPFAVIPPLQGGIQHRLLHRNDPERLHITARWRSGSSLQYALQNLSRDRVGL